MYVYIYIYHHSFGMKLIDLNYRWQLAAFGGISCWSAIAYPSADPLLIAPLLSGRWKYPYTNGWKFPINSSKPHQVTAIPKVSFVYGCISYIISNPIHPSVTLVQTSHQHSAQLLHTELVLFRSIGRKDPGEFKGL